MKIQIKSQIIFQFCIHEACEKRKKKVTFWSITEKQIPNLIFDQMEVEEVCWVKINLYLNVLSPFLVTYVESGAYTSQYTGHHSKALMGNQGTHVMALWA